MKMIRVKQGESIPYQGEWYNQGAVLAVPDSMEFQIARAKYDAAGKYLGDEVISQVEILPVVSQKEEE